MRVRLIVGWLVVLSVVAAIGYAQQPPVRRLGLAEALDIARRNNPDYLTVVANRSPAASAAFASAMALFTPTASIGAGEAWTQAGVYNLQGLSFPTPRTQGSSWNLNFGYILSGQTIANRGYYTAQLHAADQDIASSLTLLETSVRQEYLNLLEAKAQADLAEHVVAKAQEALNLAQAKYNVGQNTMIDVRSAQVDKGTADVNLLTAQGNVELEVLRVFRLLGVPAPEPARIEPTDTFPVVAPAWSQDSLVALALAQNPVLLALRARERAASWNTRAAYSSFAPSIQASASYGKFNQTSWNQASDPVTKLPFGPDTVVKKSTGISPWNFRIGFSLPIYEQFQRTATVAQARAAENVLDLSIRARELQVRADVSSAYVLLDTAYRTIAVQRNNQAAADEALSLATERYRVGSGSIIELLTARVTSETASTNYITAVYNYHKAIAALEQAVGRTLR
jgi:outer membrane protein